MENIKEILRSKSLKLTKQRLLVASFLFDGHHKHVTAEDLFKKLNNCLKQTNITIVHDRRNILGFCPINP